MARQTDVVLLQLEARQAGDRNDGHIALGYISLADLLEKVQFRHPHVEVLIASGMMSWATWIHPHGRTLHTTKDERSPKSLEWK